AVEESKRDSQTKTKKSFTIRLGQHDATNRRLYAMSQDWPRINEISDELASLALNKSALDYRHKRLFDFAAADVIRPDRRRIDLPSIAGGAVGLMTTPPSLARLGFVPAALADRTEVVTLERKSGWDVTAPVRTQADASKVDALAERLGKLDLVSWVAHEDS